MNINRCLYIFIGKLSSKNYPCNLIQIQTFCFAETLSSSTTHPLKRCPWTSLTCSKTPGLTQQLVGFQPAANIFKLSYWSVLVKIHTCEWDSLKYLTIGLILYFKLLDSSYSWQKFLSVLFINIVLSNLFSSLLFIYLYIS